MFNTNEIQNVCSTQTFYVNVNKTFDEIDSTQVVLQLYQMLTTCHLSTIHIHITICMKLHANIRSIVIISSMAEQHQYNIISTIHITQNIINIHFISNDI